MGASPATFGFAFRGARIVPAVIDSLAFHYGLGSIPGHRLLFGGCSAGAIGAMNNLDAVAAQAASLPFPVETKGFLDAAALVNILPAAWPWSNDLIPLQTLVYWLVSNVQPTFPASCTALYSGVESWKCLWSSFRLPLLSTPYFTNAVQYDDFLIQYETNNLAPHDAPQTAFVDSFQTAYLALIKDLPAGTGVFSPTCLVHCLSGQATYSNFQILDSDAGSNVSMADALDAWYFGNQTVSVVSKCEGWKCTEQCGVVGWGASIPCNIGITQDCVSVALPGSLPDEPAPATEDAPQVVPGDSLPPAPPGVPSAPFAPRLAPPPAAIFLRMGPKSAAPIGGQSADISSDTFAPALSSPTSSVAAGQRKGRVQMLAGGALVAALLALGLALGGMRRSPPPLPSRVKYTHATGDVDLAVRQMPTAPRR